MADDSSEVTLTLDSLAFGGEAVARGDDGRVVFVAGGAPGDRARARVVEDKRSFRRAELVRVLEPGAARVEPPCPLVARCGGCPWQHVAGAAQRAAKQAIVERALAKSGAAVQPLAAAPAELGYRTRARMTVRAQLDGGVAVGFVGRRSHEVVDVDRCLALDPRLDAALQAARRALGALVGDGGAIAGLVVGDGAELVVGDNGAGVAGGGAAGVELAIERGAGGDAALAKAAAALVGQAGITRVTVDDARAPAAGFAQANAAQNAVLRRIAVDATAARGRRVLELYAGDGNFTRDLLPLAAGGVAVEGDRHAGARLQALLATAPAWRALAEPAGRAVDRLIADDARFDVVLLDPPRAGAAEAVDGIARLGPARIVYVSCDPMTLARDVARLGQLGYRTRSVWPVDMMPQTWHIEVVCLLERA